MSEWKEYKFSDFADINPKVPTQAGVEYSFIEMPDLEAGYKFVGPSRKREAKGLTKFQNGDTLFAKITPCLENGKICQARNLENNTGVGSTEFIIFRGKENISDTEFIHYLLKFTEVKDYAIKNMSGSAGQQRVPLEAFDNLLIPLPPLPEQQSIAAILSSLDNKIDLLRRQNQTLEQLAQTIFKQWFVDSENEDWQTAKLSDYAFVNQRTVDKNYPYPEIEYLDTGSITEGTIESFQLFNLNDAPSRAQRLVQKNDIVYSLVRPIQKHYGLLKEVKFNTVVSTGFAVIACNKIDPHFIYLLLTQQKQIEYFETLANNSTSTYPSLKPSDISNLEFKLPPDGLLKEFSGIASSLWDKISTNQKEIQTLTQLRDSLLPRLMSGRLRAG